ncbi:MAG: site-specific integrase [Acidimicrobiales bacterium]
MRVHVFNPGCCADLPPGPPVGIPRGMPFLLDDDGAPVHVVNDWLRSLPTTGVPAPKSWAAYAGDLAAWVRFLHRRDQDILDDPEALARAVASYHADRRVDGATGRLSAASWNRAVAAICRFYEWAEGQRHRPGALFVPQSRHPR